MTPQQIQHIRRRNSLGKDNTSVGVTRGTVCKGQGLFSRAGYSCGLQYGVEDTPRRDEGINGCASWEISTGIADHERYMNKLVIGRRAVADKLFLAQVLTMIGSDDQQGAIKSTTCTQLVEECAYLLILARDLGVIHTVECELVFFCNRGG